MTTIVKTPTVPTPPKAPAPTAAPRLVAYDKGNFVHIWCPGCETTHTFYAGPPPNPIPTAPTAALSYNGRHSAGPTFGSPLSVPRHPQFLSQDYIAANNCIFQITKGEISFDVKCGHALAGKTAPLPTFPKGTFVGDKIPDLALVRNLMA